MPLETASKVLDLNPAWPLGNDLKSQGDDHLRMVKAVLINAFPVGSVLYNTTGTNPSEYIGGTWAPKAPGRAIVGVGNNGESDWVAGEQRGSETHMLDQTELPVHSHGAGTLSADQAGAHTHSYTQPGAASTSNTGGGEAVGTAAGTTSSDGAHTHTVSGDTDGTGGSLAHNNVQPSEAVYVWERTA